MSAYVVAELRFRDRASYDRYQVEFPDVFRRFGGRILAADEKPVVLEGRWDRDKLVLLEFPTRASAQIFLQSPAYQAIAAHRRRGADTLALLVRGLSRQPALDEDATVPGLP